VSQHEGDLMVTCVQVKDMKPLPHWGENWLIFMEISSYSLHVFASSVCSSQMAVQSEDTRVPD
jgi:hypothetical protein